jgi:hypothetical protein
VKHGRKTRHWTTGDLGVLRANAHLGAERLARLLGCTPCAVRMTAHRHRISLRRPGVRCGLVLGQPRGVSLSGVIRDDLVSGRVDPELIAERMRIDAEAELCPFCGRRPVRVRATGLCLVCHKGLLTERHREVVDEHVAHRDYNRAKQAAKRTRDREGAKGAACRT